MSAAASSARPETTEPAEGHVACWRTHPARRKPAAALLAVAAVLLASFAVGGAAGSPAAGVLAAALLVLNVRHFFFPTEYAIDERGVAVRCLGVETRRTWSRLRRFRHDASGGFLSTRVRPSVLDSFTGLHLTWAGNRDEAVRVIEGRMAGGGESLLGREPAGSSTP